MSELDTGSGLIPVPIHDLPVTSSDERMHILDDTCWCSPTVAYVNGFPHQVFHHQRPAKDAQP